MHVAPIKYKYYNIGLRKSNFFNMFKEQDPTRKVRCCFFQVYSFFGISSLCALPYTEQCCFRFERTHFGGVPTMVAKSLEVQSRNFRSEPSLNTCSI